MARRRQSVTIKHVAADAGVSLQTVSRVTNNEPNVRPAMKSRVQASIDKLGYVPSIAAQRLSGSRSYLILALKDRERTIADWTAREGGDWADQMLLGGMLKAGEHGYRMLIELVDSHGDRVERELGAALSALRPDGVILTPPHSENPQITGLLERRGIRFARIGSKAPGPGIAMTMDDDGAAAEATRHLLDLGHTRVGFIAGPEEYSLSDWRKAGWKLAMDDAGLDREGLCVRGNFGFESRLAAARKLLALGDRPTAIIGSSDFMTLATLEIAREMGLDVPRDLSLISFDNTPIVRFSNPQLTAIDQPIAKTISRAVELLIDRDGAAVEQPVVVSGKLTIRHSTAPPPAPD